MFKRTIAAFFIVLCIGSRVLTGSVFGAEDFNSVTTGKRAVVSHNIQQARQNAVSDALSAAVQNAFVSFLTGQALGSNLDFLYNRILIRPLDFIITYRVLGEIENNNHFLVAVESKVNLDLLEKTLIDAKILNTGMDKPVILFFIAEKTLAEDLPKYWWTNDPLAYDSVAEKIIADKMIQDQFELIGNSPERPDPSFYNITFSSMDDIDSAKALGREMKADMIVFGQAVSSEAINRMGEEKTFDAEILLDGYDIHTGEKVIHSKVQAVAKSDIDEKGHFEALVKAADQSAQDLIEKINSYWNRNLKKEQRFDLNLSGENFLPRFIALKLRFNQIPEIETILQKEIGSTSALMELLYRGKPSQFANSAMLITFDSFGLEIMEVTDSQVTIRFIEKNPTLLPGISRDTPSPAGEKKVPAQ